MARVLITGGSTRNALAYARSLGRRGVDVVVGGPTPRSMTFYSRYASGSFTYPDPAEDTDAFFSTIREAVRERDVDVALPLGEAALEAVLPRRDEIEQHAVLPFVDYETFEICRDKGKAVRAAEERGIGVPETGRPADLDDALRHADEVGYPVVLKPRRGHGSRGTTLAGGPEELREKFSTLTEEYGPYLVQEFIPGTRAILDVPMLFDHGRPVASMVSNRVRQFPENGPNCFGHAVVNEELRTSAVDMMAELEWHGVCLAEFKVDERDGEPKLMEVNPRSWGSTYLGIISGIDFPHLLYRMARGEHVDPVTDYRTDLKARWLLPGDLVSPFVSHQKISDIGRWTRDFFDPDVRYYILSRRDPAPALARLLEMATAPMHPSKVKGALFRGV